MNDKNYRNSGLASVLFALAGIACISYGLYGYFHDSILIRTEVFSRNESPIGFFIACASIVIIGAFMLYSAVFSKNN